MLIRLLMFNIIIGLLGDINLRYVLIYVIDKKVIFEGILNGIEKLVDIIFVLNMLYLK